MPNNIVTLNVSQTVAPNPSTLQQTGAFLSSGGTTLAPGSYSYLTQFSDLAPLLVTPGTLATLAWTGGTVTATSSTAHGYPIGKQIPVTIAGAVPSAFNGTYLATITTTTQFTYALANNPGSATTPGTYISGSVSELTAMATTFFAQGSSIGVYVVELGIGDVAGGTAALSTFINNNNQPQLIYDYLVPQFWDGASPFVNFLQNYNATTAKTYFTITTTDATRSSYPNTYKCAYLFVDAPGISPTEFGAAADFWQKLNNNPGPANRVAPLAFRFVTGVTPYPTVGNSTKFNNWKAQGVNWHGTGAEGGISNVMIFWGRTADGRPWNYWFSVDWMQINLDLRVANAVMNGSNGPVISLSPDGINRVQAVIVGTMMSAVTYGLALGTVIQTELDAVAFMSNLENGVYAGNLVCNAVPFNIYYGSGGNPSDYKTGTYNGFYVTYTPMRGFESITINLNVTDFVAA